MDVQIHAFLTSEVDEGEWQTSSRSHFTSGKEPWYRYPTDTRLGEPKNQSGLCATTTILPPKGLELRPLDRPGRSQSVFLQDWRKSTNTAR
jgi:hypothetical protein